MRERLLLVLVVAVAGSLIGSSGARGDTCSNPHCYGILNWDSGSTSLTGFLGNFSVARLSVTSPGSNFATHEMWVSTNNTGATGNVWVEAGIIYGIIQGANRGLASFWAEQNTAGQYAEHFLDNLSYGAGYYFKISYSGSSSWGVYLNGTSAGGTSHNQPCCSHFLQAGSETTLLSALLTGSMTALQKRLSDNSSWTYDWGAGYFTNHAPPTASWTTTGKVLSDTAN